MTSKKIAKDYNLILAETVAAGMQELKASEIVLMDMRKVKNAMTDYMVICHGGSHNQVEAIARSVEKQTGEKLNDKPWHIEGMRNSQWILMDYVNVVAHIFDKESRYFYALEELWADATTTKLD
ncbi:MAG: ribosome silencing factor [Flavobacteriales bacterium]